MAYEFLSKSPDDTRSLGRKLGGLLRPGDTVLLFGDIGMGKTVFVNGLADALGIDGPVASPTFTIANVYDSAPPFYHFDAYRIDAEQELLDTGFYDYAGGDGILAFEWAERLHESLPADRVEVRISSVPGDEEQRLVRVGFFGNGADRESCL